MQQYIDKTRVHQVLGAGRLGSTVDGGYEKERERERKK